MNADQRRWDRSVDGSNLFTPGPRAWALIALFFICVHPPPSAALSPASDRPNVILIITDDQGYGDLSATGNPILKTPNIDRLAAEGASLRRFYVSPVCTPTRAALMTGRYNYRTRAIDTYIGRSMMDPTEVTVAEVLRDAGYATGIFGKWHLGDCYPMRPGDQGFEESLVHKGGGLRQPANPPDGERYFDPILWHNGKPGRRKGYCTDIFFDAAIGFIESRHKAGKPFFTYIATNAPHDPFDEVPQAHYDHYKGLTNDRDARIFAMIANIDDNVGRLLKRLDDLKLADNTLILYMHDNGPIPGRYNTGLRGGKGSIYEGGIRSPLFARWPERLQAGYVSAQPAAHIDVMPTLLDACGVETPGNVQFDGRGVLPLLAGDQEPQPQRTLFSQWHRGDVPVLYHNFAAVTTRWKLLNDTNAGSETLPGEPKFELYDLLTDPGETKNLAAQHPDIVADLKRQYEEWFADVGSTRPDNYAPPPIDIGSAPDRPVILTPQDIRGVRREPGWWVPGSWRLRVSAARDYDIRVRLRAPLAQPATARLKIGPVEREASLPAGAAEVLFDNVPLQPGDADLEARLAENTPNNGVFQVDVTW